MCDVFRSSSVMGCSSSGSTKVPRARGMLYSESTMQTPLRSRPQASAVYRHKQDSRPPGCCLQEAAGQLIPGLALTSAKLARASGRGSPQPFSPGPRLAACPRC